MVVVVVVVVVVCRNDTHTTQHTPPPVSCQTDTPYKCVSILQILQGGGVMVPEIDDMCGATAIGSSPRM